MKFCFLHDPEHPFRLGYYGRKNPGICEIEKSLLPAYPVNFQKVFSFQGFKNYNKQLFHNKRLKSIVKGSFFYAAYGQTGLIGGRQHNAFGGGAAASDNVEQFDTSHSRHGDIDEGYIHQLSLLKENCRFPGIALNADVPEPTDEKTSLEAFQKILLVIHKQNTG
jgi:hypothetical protein